MNCLDSCRKSSLTYNPVDNIIIHAVIQMLPDKTEFCVNEAVI